MHTVTHLLTGWTVASLAGLERRDRVLVAWAGAVADVDGLGLIVEMVTANSDRPLHWFGEYHRYLAHNAGFALLVGLLALWLCRRRPLAPLLALVSYHLHILGDLAGSRGPDGYSWPVPYLLPFSRVWQLTWEGQWQLNAWPNILLTLALLLFAFYWAWRKGWSPLEAFSPPADRLFVAALRARFGPP